AQLVAGRAVVVLAGVDALDDAAVGGQVLAALDVGRRRGAARPVQGEEGPDCPKRERGEDQAGLGTAPARTAGIGGDGWHGFWTTLGRRSAGCNVARPARAIGAAQWVPCPRLCVGMAPECAPRRGYPNAP